MSQRTGGAGAWFPSPQTRRIRIALTCSQCGSRNYKTTKARSHEALNLKKYCKSCQQHTLHIEAA
ncbi:MAG TPA: 50S ribosomal protein L33 [Polyangiaceae bacterium]|jgi:large subunit ribosomal protein L33